MPANDFNALAAFLLVADERSFTRAARRLGLSPSALSHTIRRVEEQIGVRLLSRTTRSVAPTDAGDRLIARLRPALDDVRDVLEHLGTLRHRPAGRVRLVVTPLAAALVLAPRIGDFARAHPDVVLEVTTTAEPVDLVAGGFDAGIQLGEFVARDMIAVRVSPVQRAAIVGSPAYFAGHPIPKSPKDLTAHRCINFARGASGTYRWEFEKNGRALTVAVTGPVVVDTADLQLRAALDGAGLAFGFESHVAPYLASGALRRVLEDWCPPFAGYYLYYPSRRLVPAALSALVDALRDEEPVVRRRPATPRPTSAPRRPTSG